MTTRLQNGQKNTRLIFLPFSKNEYYTEDFSNNIEHYFSNPEKFKQHFPKIQNWINKFIKENK